MNQIIYRVDVNDRITFVNSRWIAFAKKKGMRLQSSRGVVGTRLWQHVSDMTARHLYNIFMAKVRKTGKTVTVPFRCDSPKVLRFMEMQIVRLSETELEFKSLLLHEQAAVPGEWSGANEPDPDPFLLMCIWCHKVKSSRWLGVEKAVRDLDLFAKPCLPLISHIICPQCQSKDLHTVIE
jgi:hypothetical protein